MNKRTILILIVTALIILTGLAIYFSKEGIEKQKRIEEEKVGTESQQCLLSENMENPLDESFEDKPLEDTKNSESLSEKILDKLNKKESEKKDTSKTAEPKKEKIDYFVSPDGSDDNTGLSLEFPFASIQKAIDLAKPGEVISLADGIYFQDFNSSVSGTKEDPIKIIGSRDAIIKGGGNGRVIEINHDYITLDGFTVDGLFGNPNSEDGYRDKLIYVQGKEIKDGVNGMKIQNMQIQNAGGECVRLRYFAQKNEISHNTIYNCGVHDFSFDAGGKNGEGIYIGTAPEQTTDGKNPTTDPDQSNKNWVHHNNINTQGNECVDIKEGASGNLVECNTCTGQKDPKSGGLDSRGSGNTFRRNDIFGNLGAGVRLGGDEKYDGLENEVYENKVYDNKFGGIKLMRKPQAKICGNEFNNNSGGNFVGNFGDSFEQKECK